MFQLGLSLDQRNTRCHCTQPYIDKLQPGKRIYGRSSEEKRVSLCERSRESDFAPKVLLLGSC